jgi:Matrixin
MTRHVTNRNLVWYAAVGALAISGCVDSAPPESRTLDVTGQSQLTITSATLLPGDTVVDRGISMVVPERGEGVWGIADVVTGHTETLSVETAMDGTVTIARNAPEAEIGAAACRSPVACDDPAFKLENHKWIRTFKWFFDAGSTPAANNKDNVEARLRSAAHNMSTGHNGCGISPHLASSAQYQGRTNEAPNVTSNGGCGRRSGHSVVGFGSLPFPEAAFTCAWFGNDQHLIEADTRINSGLQWYATEDPPSGCAGNFGIEPVMTHEFGHSFGLAHVDECTHGRLTMSEHVNPCDNSQNTLGLGDIKGMQQMY